MKPIQRNLMFIVAGAGLLALGAAGGSWWAMYTAPTAPASGALQDTASKGERKVLYWYDPMYPQQHFDKPGKSPFMDMELVPRLAGENDEGTGVKIDPAVTQNLGVRLAKVERISLATQIEATGLIGFNEREVAEVQSRAGGFVERVWPLAPGDVIRSGQPLAEFLVPEWTAAQLELLAIRSTGDASLLSAARDRLRLLGMPEGLIREVEQSGAPRTRHTVASPTAGLLQTLEVRQGMTVTAGQTLARINGLGTVWLEVAVPEAQASAVRVGDRAEARLASFPGEVIEGRVTAILPALSEAARTLRVRVELPNRAGRLRPGLSALVTLRSTDSGSALAVPTEAVIRTGKRSLVMTAGDHGRFTPAEVNPGREIGDRTVILSGLSEGQQVVASGQFLIDSEANLSGIMTRAAETAPEPSLHQAEAVIEEINDAEATLAHGPFRTLSMPGMTMVFPLARPELAKGWKAGDKATVFVRETDEGLIVERMEKPGSGK